DHPCLLSFPPRRPSDLVMRCLHQPARQQRVGEWGLVAALLAAGLVLAPSWLHVPLVGGISASSTVTPAVDSTGSPNRATAEGGEIGRATSELQSPDHLV